MTARLSITFGLAVLLAAGGALAYLVAISQNDAIEQTVERLAAYEATISTQSEFEAQLKSVQQQSASLAGLVTGGSAALAAASIQNDVRTIASQVGGEVRKAQNLPTITANSFEKVEIAYEVSLPLNRLKDFLYQIESHIPYLFL